MTSSFSERVIIVTGAASGIGGATAAELHARGASVVATDLAPPQGATPFDFVQADLLEDGDVLRVIEEATARAGVIHGLCNVAGGDPEQGAWQATLDANLTTTYRMTEAAAPFLRAGSAVVNVASLVGVVIGERPAYASAKAGIVGLTRAHARLLGPRGIRVNCIAPGVIETPAWGESGVGEEWTRIVPLRRCGYPDDVARVIAFLASDDAAYVSGACLVVDGALSTALGPEPD